VRPVLCRRGILRPEVELGRIGQLGIDAVESAALRGGQLRPARRGAVVAIPQVLGERERLRGGVRPDVHERLHVGPAKNDEVVLEPAVAAGREVRAHGLLEDAQHPFSRVVNRAVAHGGPVHAHVGHRGLAADERACLDGDVLGLVRCILRAEDAQSSRAADVHPPVGAVKEQAAAHGDVAGAALGLRAGVLREALAPDEPAALDQPAVAADHVRGLAAPALAGAIAHDEVVDAGELDRVEVPPRPDVLHAESLQDDVMGGRVESPPVVDVDPVLARPAQHEVPQRDVGAVGQVPAAAAALEDGRVVLVGPLDDDRRLGRAAEILDVDARPVAARGDPDSSARPGIAQGPAQGGVVLDAHGRFGRGGGKRDAGQRNGGDNSVFHGITSLCRRGSVLAQRAIYWALECGDLSPLSELRATSTMDKRLSQSIDCPSN